MSKQLFHLSWFIGVLVLGGCVSTFEPRLNSGSLGKPLLPTARDVRAGVEISMEEYASPQKSRRAFDAEVAPHGVLPLLIHIANGGAESFKMRREEMVAFLDGQPLAPMLGFEAAQAGANRNPLLPALVNTAALGPLGMYFGAIALAGSFSQTQSVNRRIEQHFERLELVDTVVKPGESTAGFVFFKMPSNQAKFDRLAVEIALETDVPEDPSGKRLRYKLSPAVGDIPSSDVLQ